MKQAQDIAVKYDTIETRVIELDILGELIHKRVVHGYFLFGKMVLANHLYKGVPVNNQELERGQRQGVVERSDGKRIMYPVCKQPGIAPAYRKSPSCL